MSVSVLPGERLNIERAFSLWSTRPRDCSKRFTTMESVSPEIMLLCFARSVHTLWAAGPHPPPSASHIMGMKVIPSSRQRLSVCKWDRLTSSYAFVALDPSSADLVTISPLKPLVMAKSRAAGAPRRHLGRYTSAGRRFEFESLFVPFSCDEPQSGRGWRRPGRSNSGFRPALLQKWKTSFRTKLWRLVRSPPHAQVRQWSPYLSTISSQKGQWYSASFIGALSQRWIIVLYSSGSACFPRVFAGTACSQDPAPLALVRFKWILK